MPPLDAAILDGSPAMVSLLLQAGADANMELREAAHQITALLYLAVDRGAQL